MPRFSVTLSDEADEWVEREAERRDRSKSQVVAAAVDTVRELDVDPFADHGDRGDDPGGEPDRTGVHRRLDELEQRLAELEQRDGREGREEPATAAEAALAAPDGETHREEPDGRTGDPRDAGANAGGDVADDELTERMERALAAVDVPGRKESVEQARRDAARWVWHRLRDEGEASTQELANPAYDRFGDETGYSEGSRYRGYGLWDSCLRDVLKELPGVVDPGPRGHVWAFDEEAAPE